MHVTATRASKRGQAEQRPARPEVRRLAVRQEPGGAVEAPIQDERMLTCVEVGLKERCVNADPIIRTDGGLRLVITPDGRRAWAFHLWHGNDRLLIDRADLVSNSVRDRVADAAIAEAQRRGLQVDPAAIHKILSDGAAEFLKAKSELDPGPKAGVRGRAVTLKEPELWAEPVDGVKLLNDLSAWVRRYVWLRKEAADTIAVWVAATWFVEDLYFAPILALISPTKRCGKTLVLDLLRYVCRRGLLTSGIGASPPVIFRLNEMKQPTFLIDEAEKLGGPKADRDLIAMLNVGYRRGATVQRCVESGGDYAVCEFEAFGFRALAAIRGLWDTILDRAIVVQLHRKLRDGTVERFNGRDIEREGATLAAQLARWAEDHRRLIAEAENGAPRPLWLHDRECDNWACLFAVAALARGDWPERVEKAARALAGCAGDDGDLGERLIQDLRAIYEREKWPEAMRSGDVVKKLNEMEDAPWSELRHGQGISTHKLAEMLRPFGVRPWQRRMASTGEKIRGYWRADLLPVFARYSPPELGQVGQSSDNEDPAVSGGGTSDAVGPTPAFCDNGRFAQDVPVVPVPEADSGGNESRLQTAKRSGRQAPSRDRECVGVEVPRPPESDSDVGPSIWERPQ